MLGYKFINTKIQMAYIKQIIYSYLFNIFLISPNYFVIPLLSVLSKDSLSLSSKESYEDMIKQNQQLKNDFYLKLQSIGGKNIINYMYLTLILNKDSKTNFNNFSNSQIDEIGKLELDNVFFEVFIEFLDLIKKEYDISNDPVENITFSKPENKKYFASNNSSLEGLINDTLFIQTLNNFETPVFITANLGKGIEKSIGYTDSLTRLDSTDNNFSGKPIIEELNKFIASNNMSGIVSEFFYKIKNKIPVELSCGAEARNNPALVSIRKLGYLFEVFSVQQYFNWKTDRSYRELDQFIFFREKDLKEILKYNSDNKGKIVKNLPFDSQTYFGMKFLNRDEILNLEKELNKSGDDSGFIAFIPVKKVDENFINDFNAAPVEKHVSLFSTEERETAFSYKEVSKLLGYNTEILDRDWRHLNDLKSNPQKFTDLSRAYSTKSLSYLVNAVPGSPVRTNFDINNLFDLFFRVNVVNYDFKNAEGYFDDLSVLGGTEEEAFRDYNPPYSKIIEKNYKSTSTKNIRNKLGKFLLLLPRTADYFDINFVGIDFRQKIYTTGKQAIPTFKYYDTKYVEIDKQIVLEVKINLKNTLDEKVFSPSQTTMARFERLFYTDITKNTEAQKLEEETLVFIKNNYSIAINEILKGQSFQDFINTFYSPEDEKSTLDFSNLVIGEINTDFGITTELRSYKNFKDFIIYYKDTVEALAREATDRV